ncbi:MAG: RNA 2',3'-cyclic phosphodiesterase [Acidobacteriota bacterium]|nr:RNA 2',3'-cyclic phosphodiesterase [Acidobacteriota bacterium]
MFCAIELPHALRERAAAHIETLRGASQEARVSWQRADNLHLTLKFLGEIERSRAAGLSEAASRASSQSQTFSLTIEGAGSFPPRGVPRVLWLGVSDSTGALARLQNILEAECSAKGFAREERPFSPHLTIARIRAPQGARTIASSHRAIGFEAFEFAVTELTVMRSELRPEGSRYTAISHHRFGEATQI